MAKISICIPTFNRADLLEKTLLSVINQTKTPYEIIVVDNFSTDNTPDIVKKYKNFGVKYYKNRKNIGIVGNWNKCIDYATGEYISILHSDDLIAPLWYDVWSKIISKNPDIDGFFSAWAFIDINDIVKSVYVPFPKNRKFKKHQVIKEFYKKNVLSPAFSGDLILKKDLYSKSKIGKFSEKLETEADIGMYFPLMSNYSLYYSNKILFGHRTHPLQAVQRGISSKSTQKIVASSQRYFKYINNFYKKDLVRSIGNYEIFYKKLIITYQFKSLLKGVGTAKMINEVIKKEFPNAIGIMDYYLYFVLGFEFLRRAASGKILSFQYRDDFSHYKSGVNQ